MAKRVDAEHIRADSRPLARATRYYCKRFLIASPDRPGRSFGGIEQVDDAVHQADRFRIGRAEARRQRGEQPAAFRPADVHHLRAVFQQLVDAGPRDADRFGLLLDAGRVLVEAQPRGGQTGHLIAQVDLDLVDHRLDDVLVQLVDGRQIGLVDRFHQPARERRNEPRHEHDVDVFLQRGRGQALRARCRTLPESR